jgi:hypothetical protein
VNPALLPAANTWEVVSASDGTAAGAYTQTWGEESYKLSTLPLETDPDYEVVDLAPTLTKGASVLNAVRLIIKSGDPSRYIIVVTPSSNGDPAIFACKSGAFNPTETTEIQALIPVELPACGGSITIDLAARTYKSTDLTLSRLSGTGTMALRMNGTWPADTAGAP